MAGGLIDEIFIALGVKVDSKDLNRLQKQFDKVLEKAKNLNKQNNNSKGVDGFLKKFQQLSKVLPKGGGEIGKLASGASKLSGILGGVGGTAVAVVGGITAIASAVIGAAAAIDTMTLSLAKNNQFYATFQRRTGMSARSISGLATTASYMDMNVSEAQATNELQGLSSRLMDLQLTGQGAIPFQLAGINPVGMNSEQVMKALNNRMQGLSNQQQAYLADQLGVSSLLPVLQLTSDKYDELIQKNKEFSLTDEQLATLMGYGAELKTIQKQWDYITKNLILKLAPVAIKISKAITNFAEQTVNISKGIANVIKLMWQLNPIVQSIVFGFKLIGSIIRDIWVLFEDLVMFATGQGDTLIGQMLGASSLQDLLNGFNGLGDAIFNFSWEDIGKRIFNGFWEKMPWNNSKNKPKQEDIINTSSNAGLISNTSNKNQVSQQQINNFNYIREEDTFSYMDYASRKYPSIMVGT